MTDENVITYFECPLSYVLKNQQQQEVSKGKAKARIEKEKLSLFAESGKPLVYPLRDISRILEKEYHLYLSLSAGQKLELFYIGFKYEDFFKELSKNRNELILQDMLIKEKVRKKNDVHGDFSWSNELGEKVASGKCLARIFETSLVIIPVMGDIIRLPMRNIDHIEPIDYGIIIHTDYNEKLMLNKMGYELDPFKKALNGTLADIAQKTQAFLQDMLPQTPVSDIVALSSRMKEGRVVLKKDIQTISPSLWIDLEKRIAQSPLSHEYLYLKSLGAEASIAGGFKRGLMGSMTDDYFWFLVPIFGSNGSAFGNAVAMEAGVIKTREANPDTPENDEPDEDESGNKDNEILKQEGKATYFFRIVSRAEYTALFDFTKLESQYDRFVVALNRSMQEVNFRREPIYLDEKRLEDPRYKKYRYSINRLPQLRLLRSLFIGRVFHKTPEQWSADVQALLKFNTQSKDDNDKWQKGG